MKLLLIRHPRPDVADGTCYGRTDVAPQAGHLRETADALRARWARSGRTPSAVFSSPLQRCALLARALAGDAWPHPRFDARIAEMDFGRWENRLWVDLPREELDAWRADIAGVAPPDGESLAALGERAHAFLGEVLPREAPADTEIVLVTHVGVIQTLSRTLCGEPMTGFGKRRIDYGSITTLVRNGERFALESLNELP